MNLKHIFFVLFLPVLSLSCKAKEKVTSLDITGLVKTEQETLMGIQNEENVKERIETEEETEIINFADYIKLTNCTITNNYFVPDILNRIMSINDDEPPIGQPIENNSIRFIWGGFQIVLKNDIQLNNEIIIVAKNSKYEFRRNLNLKPIGNYLFDYYSGNNDISGYYDNIYFENKFWLSDGNPWQFTVKSNENILLNGEIPSNLTASIIFDKLDETPFIINNLRNVNLHKEYTYRFMRTYTDLIVIYYHKFDYIRGYGIYRPIIYILPNKNETGESIDIGISWNHESVRGDYHFGFYKINELPVEEKMYAVMDFVQVR